MSLSTQTQEKIYAGVLGKIIGVYAGRPFENWSWEKIESTFGEVNRYVNSEVNEDLIVADDDITGTSMFVKAIQDHHFNPDFGSKHIGQTWLDILIENKTVFWWGGYNMSTEHTAYLNLKNGIEAPDSGSIETNGKISAEQIGAQIFIDYWGLINPNDPDKAVAMAKESARVGHDGEAVYGAVVIAALVSMSFKEGDINTLLDGALKYVPENSDIARVIAFVRQLHRQEPNDWRWAFGRLREEFGYHKFGGMCHMVPNHGLIILSLLYGGDSFHKSMVIVNTLGWDTDCNAANVGCINAVRLGLNSLTSGYDWRGPVADRIYLPTAHSTDNVTDAVREANCLVAIAETLLGNPKPDSLPRFSFNYLGAVQGFKTVAQDIYDERARLENTNGDCLSLVFRNLVKDRPLALQTLTHTCESDDVRRYPYHLLGSPTLYSGQQVKAVFSCEINVPSIRVVPYIVTFDQDLNRAEYDLSPCVLLSGEVCEHEFTITQVKSEQIAYLGFRLEHPFEGDGVKGCLYIHSIDWASTPSLDLNFPASEVGQWVAPWWANSFISTMTQEMFIGSAYLMNDTPGEKRMFVYGSNDFKDYTAQIGVTPQSLEPWSVVFHYLGLKRYVEARFDPVSETLSLILNHFDTQKVLATESFKFEQRKSYEINLNISQDKWQIEVEETRLECSTEQVVGYEMGQGCIGVANEFGSMQLSHIKLQPIA